MLDPRIRAAEPFSSDELAAIESALGVPLPVAYRAFVSKFGGAFVGGFVNGLSIMAFFKAGNDNGILRKLLVLPDLNEIGALPFAGCELGNLFVLRADGAVYYIDYWGGRTTAERVSDNFADFLERIVIPEDE